MRDGLLGLLLGGVLGGALAGWTVPAPPPPARAIQHPRPAEATATAPAQVSTSCEDEVSWLRGELLRLGDTPLGWTEASAPEERQLGYAVTGQGLAQRHEGVSLATVECSESPCISFFIVDATHWPHPDFLTGARQHYGNDHARRFIELSDRVIVLVAATDALDDDTLARLSVRLDEASEKLRGVAR